jgi:hypothetical protein
MAAFDMGDPKSVVSPGGVGFDINCGVRLLRTNLYEKDVLPVKVSTLLDFTHISYSLKSVYAQCTLLDFTHTFQSSLMPVREYFIGFHIQILLLFQACDRS